MGGSETGMGTTDLELRLRPQIRFTSALRVLAASLAAEHGYDIASLADFRTAVEDIFTAMLQRMAPPHVDACDDLVLIVRFSTSGDRLDVAFETESALLPLEWPDANVRLVGTAGDRLIVDGARIALARAHALATTDGTGDEGAGAHENEG
jgi:hypothetical protein